MRTLVREGRHRIGHARHVRTLEVPSGLRGSTGCLEELPRGAGICTLDQSLAHEDAREGKFGLGHLLDGSIGRKLLVTEFAAREGEDD